jgi:hypothetical protein
MPPVLVQHSNLAQKLVLTKRLRRQVGLATESRLKFAASLLWVGRSPGRTPIGVNLRQPSDAAGQYLVPAQIGFPAGWGR